MIDKDDNNESKRPVLRYVERINDKGKKYLKPVYLNETPQEEIDRLNNKFSEWKTTKQKNKNGKGGKI